LTKQSAFLFLFIAFLLNYRGTASIPRGMHNRNGQDTVRS